MVGSPPGLKIRENGAQVHVFKVLEAFWPIPINTGDFFFVKSKNALKISENFPKIPPKNRFFARKNLQKAIPTIFEPQIIERGPNDHVLVDCLAVRYVRLTLKKKSCVTVNLENPDFGTYRGRYPEAKNRVFRPFGPEKSPKTFFPSYGL